MNVLRQAEKAGVKKFVVTSSTVTMMGDDAVKGTAYRSERRLFLLRSDLGSESNYVFPFTDWNPVTKEDALGNKDEWAAYNASKKYAELAVWEWADAHPHVDVTTSELYRSSP